MMKQNNTSGKAIKYDKTTTYLAGYIVSVFLTVAAYLIVTRHLGSRYFILAVISGLALFQFIVQVLFFLNLGREMRPRLKLLVFLGMLMIVIILVGGSLWIMSNLNYRMMQSKSAINNYMNQQSGNGF